MEKKCNNCGTEGKNVNVPFVVYQATAARQERQVKRLWVALIVAIALMFLTNMMWVGVFSSYDYSSEEITYTQDGQGTNIIGDSNNVNGAEIDNSQGKSGLKRMENQKARWLEKRGDLIACICCFSIWQR